MSSPVGRPRRRSATARSPHAGTVHRPRGPLFLADRKAPARTPALDRCPTAGRVRLACRRAEESASLHPVCGDFEERNLALEVVELLGWKECSDFERDLLGAGEE